MKKLILAVAMITTLAVALMTSASVFAQSTTPPAVTPAPGTGYGYGRGGGMMGARGGMAGDGILHDAMIATYAEKLGISVDDLNARLAKGETMAQIAASKGLTADQFTTLMKDARNQAIDAAVKAGTLTQAQADWMKTRGGMMGANNGAGRGAGMGRGMRGAGMGNPATCPYFPQTNS